MKNIRKHRVDAINVSSGTYESGLQSLNLYPILKVERHLAQGIKDNVQHCNIVML